MSADPIKPGSRRALILQAASTGPVTLSEIERQVRPNCIASRGDKSLHRLKVTSAVRRLKADGLLAKSPFGWAATADGVALDRRLRAHA